MLQRNDPVARVKLIFLRKIHKLLYFIIDVMNRKLNQLIIWFKSNDNYFTRMNFDQQLINFQNTIKF